MATDFKDLKTIWESGSTERTHMDTLQKYYEGTNALTGTAAVRKDGEIFTHIVVNWYDFVASFLVGFMTSERTEYTVPEGKKKTGLDTYLEVYKQNNLDAAAIEHLTNAIVYGRSVEVHSFDGKDIQITTTQPKGWVFVRDETAAIQIAVYQSKVLAGSMFQGEILKKDLILYYVYNSENVTIFKGGEDDPVSTTEHQYGRVPVVEFSVTPGRSTLFAKSFIASANAYNLTFSMLEDEIRINLNSLLMTSGVDAATWEEKDEHGVTAMQNTKRMGVLPLDPGQTAAWLTRNIDIAKFERSMEFSRKAIHQQGFVPDITQSLSKGAVAAISGVALKLLYQPTLLKTGQYAVYYKQGLRERIELINIVNGLLNRPTLDDVDIVIRRNVPQNATEIAQYYPALIMAGGISRLEVLRQLPFIDDPEKVLEEIERQVETQPQTNGVQNNEQPTSNGAEPEND